MFKYLLAVAALVIILVIFASSAIDTANIDKNSSRLPFAIKVQEIGGKIYDWASHLGL